MGELSISELIKTAQDAGAVGLLAVILIGGLRQWWVFGWIYRDLRRERDAWRDLALSGTSLAQHSVQLLTQRSPFGDSDKGA